MKLLLGSKSPRRAELLQAAGFGYTLAEIFCDEAYLEDLPPENVAAYISEKKSRTFRPLSEDEVLLTADTVVVLDAEVFGKPESAQQAAVMLRKLSGRRHTVITGVTFRSSKRIITKTDAAVVTFAELSDEDIIFYIENYSPLDKAGAYGVQDWLGMRKITGISGSFYTVMGLPLHLIADGILEVSK